MWINRLTLMLPVFMRTGLNIASYAISLLVMVYVIIGMKKLMASGKKERTEDIYFLRVCNIMILDMIVLLSFLLWGYIPKDARFLLSYSGVVGGVIIIHEILKYLFPLTWLVFFDYSVYKSKSRIKNRYKFAFIPYIILVALWIAIRYMQKIELAQASEMMSKRKIELTQVTEMMGMGEKPIFYWLQTVYNYFGFFLCLGYMLYAYLIIRSYTKEIKQPQFMRLDAFATPWALGIILTVITGLNLDSMFNSISLLLVFFTIRKRHYYLDDETDFYCENYIPRYEAYAKGNGFKRGSAMYLFSTAYDLSLGKVIWKYRIPKSVVIRMNRGGYVLLAHVTDENALNSFISLIKDAAHQEDDKFNVTVKKWIKTEAESILEFSEWVQKEIEDDI